MKRRQKKLRRVRRKRKSRAILGERFQIFPLKPLDGDYEQDYRGSI